MASENLEFGISINISGNYQQAANQVDNAFSKAGQSVNSFNSQLKQSSGAADQSLGGLLAIQSSLFVITKLAADASRVGFGITKGITGAFIDAVESSANLEKSTATLKFVFKDTFDLAQRSIIDLKKRLPESQQVLTDLASRLASIGLSAKDIFQAQKGGKNSGLENIVAGLTRLTGQDRARALNSIANALTDINSFQRLFNVGVTTKEKDKFQSLNTEIEKSRFILGLFEKKFGGIFGPEGLAGSLIFNTQRAFNQLTTLVQDAFAPALKVLAPVFAEIADEVARLRDDKRFIASLSQAFITLGKVAAMVVKGIFLIVKAITGFIAAYPSVTTGIVLFTTLASIIVGIGGAAIATFGTLLLLDLAIGKIGASSLLSAGGLGLFNNALRLVGLSSLAATGGVGALSVAMGVLFSPMLAIISLVAAASFIPKFFDLWATAAGKVLDVLIIIMSVISGVIGGIVGFFVGGPVGAIAGAISGFSATFAALTAAAPGPRGSRPTTTAATAANVQGRRQEDFATPRDGASFDDLKTSLDALSRSIELQQFNINNTVMLDGQVVSNSVNKINKQKQDRYPSQ